jgi:hypothetical protein
MTPHRTGGKIGHFRFDRVFKGVGRINVSSGTSSKREFARRNAILDELYDAGQLETLRDVKRGDRKAVELRAAARKGKLTGDSLAADLALARPLWDIDKVKGAVSETLDKMKIAESSRERYYTSFRELQTIAGSVLTARSTVAALARVDWGNVWPAWKVSNATKNRARAALSAFLTAFLGDLYHPFRREIMKSIEILDEPKLPREITPEEFWTLMDKVPDYAVEDFVTWPRPGSAWASISSATGPTSIPRLALFICLAGSRARTWSTSRKNSGPTSSVPFPVTWRSDRRPGRVCSAILATRG